MHSLRCFYGKNEEMPKLYQAENKFGYNLFLCLKYISTSTIIMIMILNKIVGISISMYTIELVTIVLVRSRLPKPFIQSCAPPAHVLHVH